MSPARGSLSSLEEFRRRSSSRASAERVSLALQSVRRLTSEFEGNALPRIVETLDAGQQGEFDSPDEEHEQGEFARHWRPSESTIRLSEISFNSSPGRESHISTVCGEHDDDDSASDGPRSRRGTLTNSL